MKDSGSVAHNEWHPCACSPWCQDMTTRRFAPGHDQRLIGWLKREMAAGRMSADQARREAINRGAGPGLLLRLATTVRRGGFE